MGHEGRSRLPAAVLILLALCTVAGCGKSPAAAGRLLQDLRAAVGQTRSADDLLRVAGNDTSALSAKTRLGGVLKRVPENAPADVAAEAARARQADAALAAIAGTLDTADDML